jgi:spore maturation protein CgeB
MKIVYSLNKKGFEAEYWTREIAAASGGRTTFVPFNHGLYVEPARLVRAQLLDNLYYDRDPGLMRMYDDLQQVLATERADALIVDNVLPYHPDFLRNVPVYKVLRTTDGPITAYDRDFAYVHAYDHVLFHSPAYSRDMDMREKLLYVGARRADFWPLALFDEMFDPAQTEETILEHERDIEIVFVGSLYVDKMPLLARLRKAFGRRLHLHGQSNWKRNAYFNAKFGFPGWVRPIPFDQYVPLYQRSQIGVNVHNRGDYTVGSYRLFELPGNGVMQISDGGRHLSAFYDVGKEIVRYDGGDDLVAKISYYLDHPEERRRIALNGFRAVMARHRLARRMSEAADLIARGIAEQS